MDVVFAEMHDIGRTTNDIDMILTALIFLVTALVGGWAFVLLGQRGMDNLPVILSFGGSFIIGMCFSAPCARSV